MKQALLLRELAQVGEMMAEIGRGHYAGSNNPMSREQMMEGAAIASQRLSKLIDTIYPSAASRLPVVNNRDIV